MEIVFLGTSCMVPTKERNVQAIFLSYGSEGILVDCGEGTQRQMNIAGINRNKVTKILISHWHGDHVSGLIGLLQTLSATDTEKTINIYGPRETKTKMAHLIKAFSFDFGKLTINVHDLSPKGVEKFYENDEVYLECARLEHKPECLGYSFVEKDKLKIDMTKAKKFGLKQGPLIGEILAKKKVKADDKTVQLKDVSYTVKGRKVSFILDTLLCNNCYALAENADVLISEATYLSALEEKARENRHLTAQQAALVASKANAKKLVLCHFSQRYKVGTEIEEEARTYFPNSVAAFDFMKIRI